MGTMNEEKLNAQCPNEEVLIDEVLNRVKDRALFKRNSRAWMELLESICRYMPLGKDEATASPNRFASSTEKLQFTCSARALHLC